MLSQTALPQSLLMRYASARLDGKNVRLFHLIEPELNAYQAQGSHFKKLLYYGRHFFCHTEDARLPIHEFVSAQHWPYVTTPTRAKKNRLPKVCRGISGGLL